MNVTIVGAGNMGLAMTAYMAYNKKADITLYTKKSINSITLNIVGGYTTKQTSDFVVSNDPEQAFSCADIIFITYPAFLRKKFIEDNQKYIKSGSFLCFVPGYGGAEYFSVDMLNKGVIITGLQRVPYVARAKDDNSGATANILSSKTDLFIGAIPKNMTSKAADLIERLLDIPTHGLREFLSITLAPSNPLLHITGLYNVFKDYKEGDIFDAPLRFYEEWNDETSKLLFSYDDELQKICKELHPLDLSEVVPLPTYYQSPSPSAMTKKLKSIESFKAVMVPLIKSENGYLPDLHSRMFVEDYPFGVCIIKDYAQMFGVNTPTVDMLLAFYERISGHKYFNEDGSYSQEIKYTGVPGINGIHCKEDVIRFYHK